MVATSTVESQKKVQKKPPKKKTANARRANHIRAYNRGANQRPSLPFVVHTVPGVSHQLVPAHDVHDLALAPKARDLARDKGVRCDRKRFPLRRDGHLGRDSKDVEAGLSQDHSGDSLVFPVLPATAQYSHRRKTKANLRDSCLFI